ncbi:hypothetical protein DSO57_1013774 [Entomophthora muscae]|uniref:Uncharacterized protein n=1 Tax=Entomophthora muscae TaxID=34485 RepID=A0ACC2S7L1_9FUNG|nr:hypothetical protein DSO57_1013774 [Entomophthora muscae]
MVVLSCSFQIPRNFKANPYTRGILEETSMGHEKPLVETCGPLKGMVVGLELDLSSEAGDLAIAGVVGRLCQTMAVGLYHRT